MSRVRVQSIDRLELLPKAALIAQFEKTFRTKPTQRASSRLLALMLAYKVQASQFGGISTAIWKRLERAAAAAEAGPLGTAFVKVPDQVRDSPDPNLEGAVSPSASAGPGL